ncbi:hypothetical protein O0L34_g17492 [Tuta absoluta]|nr:hypothetical protein O0L34_g17492 [Tuta absoluta]
MSKSTIEAIEKVLLKIVQPLEMKITKIYERLDEVQAQIRSQKSSLHKDEGMRTKNTITQEQKAPASFSKVTQNPTTGTSPSPSLKETTPAINTRVSARSQPAKKSIGADRNLPLPNRKSTGNMTTSSITNETRVAPKSAGHQTIDQTKQVREDESRNHKEINDDNSHEWKTVVSKYQRKKQQKTILVGESVQDDTLKAVDRLKYLQAWSFKPSTTVEEITRYMNNISVSPDFYVEKRKINTKLHASFILGIPESMFDQFYSPTVWPQGVRLAIWFLRRPRGERGAEQVERSATDTAE